MSDDDKRHRRDPTPRGVLLPSAGSYRFVEKERLVAPSSKEASVNLEDPAVWRTVVSSKVNALEAKVDVMDENVGKLSGQVAALTTRIGTVMKLVWPLVPIGITSAAGFVITAYVAFARLDDARAEQDHHEQMDVTLAHPGAAEQLTKIREAQSGTRADIQAFLREQERRDAEARERMERMERRLDAIRQRR